MLLSTYAFKKLVVWDPTKLICKWQSQWKVVWYTSAYDDDDDDVHIQEDPLYNLEKKICPKKKKKRGHCEGGI